MNGNMTPNTADIHPPKWPLRLLRFFLKKEYVEEIEGDMEEIFRDNVERLSYQQARLAYAWEIVRLLRPILVKNLEVLQNLNHYGMFKNYFKISFRGLMKNPLNSFINVFGLAAAIGIGIFGYAFARWTFSTDQFHEHKQAVFLVTFFANRDGTPQQYGLTPRPLGEMLKGDFTHIEKVCRVEDRNVVVKYEDNVFHERVRYTDPEFLEMLTFPMKWGTSRSLADINSIILSEEMAIKYFGDENPLGLSMLVKFDKDKSKAFKISGVAKEFPKSRTIDFNFLINFENLRSSESNYDFHDWRKFVNATLIQVDDPAAIRSIEQGMTKFTKLQNEAVEKDWAVSSFALEPLATLHERSENIRDDISYSSSDNYESIVYLVVMDIVLLALACINYINIAIVSATKRLKEIGIRKSIGATRRIVVVQFLSENVVITTVALLVGLFLAMFVFIPGFEQMWHFSMDFNLMDWMLWIYLPLILLFTSIASGIYPSLYISKFEVVGILKGSLRFGKKNPLTKIFLGFQLILACLFITSAVMFTQNSSFLGKRSWGYNQSETLYAIVPDRAAYEQLNALIAQEATVLSISASTHHIGKSNTKTVLHLPDRQNEVDHLAVDAKYFETMGLTLKEGRLFEDHEGSDKQAVVVTELLVNNMLWVNPIGQQFKIDSVQYEVVGVIKDFHNYSFSKSIRPIIFTIADKNEYRYLSIRVASGTEVKSFKMLQAKWAELFPEIPFEGGHQEDVWGNYFVAIGIYGTVWRVFAFIAISLAGLGLYGLMTLNVAGRVKEFSIRKVLGAGLKNIVANISNQYVLLFAIALSIGTPLSYILITWLLDAVFPYHVPITFSGVAFSTLPLILVLVITVVTQISKLSNANPVDGLKVE